MKRLLAILLCLVMLLSACSSGGTGNTDPSTEPSNSATGSLEVPSKPSTDPTTAPTDEPTTAPTEAPTTATTEAPTTAPTQAPTEKPPVTCSHTYKNATCTTPKTCTKCGTTEGKALGHSYKNATCTAPKTCSRCGVTDGKALGHSWTDATCTAPKTCSRCGTTEGGTTGHNYSNGTCTVCGAVDPRVPFTGNSWRAYIVTPGSEETGEELDILTLDTREEVPNPCYFYIWYYSNPNYEEKYFDTVTYNGKTYYNFSFSGSEDGIAWEDNGDTVNVTVGSRNGDQLVLTRTGDTQFTVTSSTAAWIPVGTIFEKR